MHLIQKCHQLGNTLPELVKVVPSRSEQTRGSSIESNDSYSKSTDPVFWNQNVASKSSHFHKIFKIGRSDADSRC